MVKEDLLGPLRTSKVMLLYKKTSAIKHLVGHLYGHYLDGTEKTLSGPKWDKDKKKSPNAFAEKQFERKLPIKK